MISSKDISPARDWYPGQVIPLPPPNPWDVAMVFFVLGLMVGVILCHIGV